ncbi:hypothetical protein [Jiella mangrovi]|uniref:Uncharacterized protein n=1 Tax=Jiella mangrovi TaxID=2821407 RepID=A0ABS4BEP0_9HYPH|nr:hypothetical protein [Jiella mangrovi]MBP0614524.1 hypothetical protein [Jiella mangrovi]
MYLDEKNQWRQPESVPEGRRLTNREEKIVLSSIAIFVVAMLIAPIGGATVIQAILAAAGF